LSDTAVQGATQFARLAVPVCFFQGDHDRCFPPELDTATRRLVGSNVAGGLIAGAGHFLHLTHAPILAKQIATFWTASEA
jgi:pimeloyl-ACP methyl ester carboxylesterase